MPKYKIHGFDNCNATAEFCKNINDAFDILNCRNFHSTSEFSKQLRQETQYLLFEKIDNLKSIFKKLNKLLTNSNRKTGFVGLIICLMNVKDLYNDYVSTNKLKFILTYKLNQDHLEMFFSAIRSRCGFNNNPSALQFRTAYRRLLVRNFIKEHGTRKGLDQTLILSIGSSSSKT